MSGTEAYYKSLAIGLAVGVVSSIVLFTHKSRQMPECEPVIDVEYTHRKHQRVGAQTVVRQPVRDGKRCLLAEVGT
jgi:hypothetical protein